MFIAGSWLAHVIHAIFSGMLDIAHQTILGLGGLWWDAHEQSHLQPEFTIINHCRVELQPGSPLSI